MGYLSLICDRRCLNQLRAIAMLFDRRSGSMGLIGLPFFLGFPWIDLLVSALLIITTVRVFVGGNIASLAIFYVTLATIRVLLALLAIGSMNTSPAASPCWRRLTASGTTYSSAR